MRRGFRFWLWPFMAVTAVVLGVFCGAADFNPLAWAWAHVMDLARAIGGRG